ncbi:MAG: arginine decarboxylase, pyruvoyl-dependent [Candidatus Hydrogenedentes bacterium]|nr:arginine decarboxylase, pyruvoyl-dependent [Candidatus Hydrogenedentota bacterium]MBI3117057.1 arginine decarboxylase, pyruvoyl-dependent [Candidatus Hydrogenedentota bacterium]
MYVPSKMFLTRGVGTHKEKLSSFEMALRAGDIAQFNLVRVSSIYPPNCKIIPRQQGLKEMRPGQIVHVVLAEAATNEPRRLMASSIGIAIPKDPNQFGYLSEFHGFGVTERKASEYAEDLAAEMFATVMGIKFDANKSWDEKREEWKISGIMLKTSHMTQTALSDKEGLWTTTVAAAVLLP